MDRDRLERAGRERWLTGIVVAVTPRQRPGRTGGRAGLSRAGLETGPDLGGRLVGVLQAAPGGDADDSLPRLGPSVAGTVELATNSVDAAQFIEARMRALGVPGYVRIVEP